jgi:hypothetical protein
VRKVAYLAYLFQSMVQLSVEILCIFCIFCSDWWKSGGTGLSKLVAPVLSIWRHWVAETGGTGLRSKFSFACIRPGGVACVQGELFVVFELWIGGLRSLLEHSFVSDVSNCCPCLRGPRLVFFK